MTNREREETASTLESERGGWLMLLVVLAPWLIPLRQALRGDDTFGWSAAIGLLLGLCLFAALMRAIGRRIAKWRAR